MATLNMDEEKYNESLKLSKKIEEIEKVMYKIDNDVKNNNIEFKTKEALENYKELINFLEYNRNELFNKNQIIKQDLLALNDKGPVPTSFM